MNKLGPCSQDIQNKIRENYLAYIIFFQYGEREMSHLRCHGTLKHHETGGQERIASDRKRHDCPCLPVPVPDRLLFLSLSPCFYPPLPISVLFPCMPSLSIHPSIYPSNIKPRLSIPDFVWQLRRTLERKYTLGMFKMGENRIYHGAIFLKDNISLTNTISVIFSKIAQSSAMFYIACMNNSSIDMLIVWGCMWHSYIVLAKAWSLISIQFCR